STLFENNQGAASLKYLRRGVVKEEEQWELTHILIPMHAKIRLSFGGLQEVGMEVAKWVKLCFAINLKVADEPEVSLDNVIMRGYRYVEELMLGGNGFGEKNMGQFCAEVSLPRYIGRIRVQNPLTGTIDVLVDTTGTVRNLECVAVVCRTP